MFDGTLYNQRRGSLERIGASAQGSEIPHDLFCTQSPILEIDRALRYIVF